MARVLIIDTDALNRNRIAELLEQRRIESDQAAGPHEAKHLLNLNDYSLVLIDLNIVDHHGLEFLVSLRAEYPAKMAHTVLMTSAEAGAFVSRGDHDWCAILLKPFSAAEFYRTVDFCNDDHDATRMGYH